MAIVFGYSKIRTPKNFVSVAGDKTTSSKTTSDTWLCVQNNSLWIILNHGVIKQPSVCRKDSITYKVCG